MWKSSEFEVALAESKATKLRPCFAEDVASLMREQVRSREPQICKGEGKSGPYCSRDSTAAMQSNVESHTASEWALRGEFTQLTRRVG